MKKMKLGLRDLIPFIAFVAIFLFFSIATNGIMFSSYNLQSILEQSMITIIVGCGVIFVVAQGSIDLSVGVNLGLAGVISMYVAIATNQPLLIFPVALIVSAALGMVSGIIVSRFKVPSFMVTIALLIAIRGVVNYIQVIVGVQGIPAGLSGLNELYIKIPAFLVIVIIMAFIFEFTKVGKYSKAIGENETTAKHAGVPITKMKIIAFVLSGLMAGVASLFTIVSLGGTSTTMGVFFEMDVVMAIYFGGVLVTGGTSAKIYKIFLGAFTITIIRNGLALMGLSAPQISESVMGSLLIIVLLVTMFAHERYRKVSREIPIKLEQK